MDYFTKSETFNAQWSFNYASNKFYLHKKEMVSAPKCHFQH